MNASAVNLGLSVGWIETGVGQALGDAFLTMSMLLKLKLVIGLSKFGASSREKFKSHDIFKSVHVISKKASNLVLF